MLVTLTTAPTTEFHGDLRFELGALVIVVDSYYFELDHSREAPGGMPAVRAALIALLAQWRVQVQALAEGASVPLPFDYSDQYTGVLVVTRHGESLDVVPGFTKVEGWAHYPSDVAVFFEMGPVVTTDDAQLERYARGVRKVSVELAAFVRAIDASLAVLEGSCSVD